MELGPLSLSCSCLPTFTRSHAHTWWRRITEESRVCCVSLWKRPCLTWPRMFEDCFVWTAWTVKTHNQAEWNLTYLSTGLTTDVLTDVHIGWACGLLSNLHGTFLNQFIHICIQKQMFSFQCGRWFENQLNGCKLIFDVRVLLEKKKISQDFILLSPS